MAIDNATGLTKYYEFGRYNSNSKGVIGEKFLKDDGNIRNVPISNVVIGGDGKPTQNSLNKIYAELSKEAGQNKSVETVYHEGADFNAMQSFIDRMANNKERDAYSLVGNNCFDFKNDVIRAGNKKEDK